MPGALPFDILSPASSRARVDFERIPQNLTRTELFRYFTFSVEARHEILECRGDHNRIGFATRWPGRASLPERKLWRILRLWGKCWLRPLGTHDANVTWDATQGVLGFESSGAALFLRRSIVPLRGV
jgi:hypothetical protein